jgi:hypothetical protein
VVVSGGLAGVAEITVGDVDAVKRQDVDDPSVGALEFGPGGFGSSVKLDELITTNDLDVDLKEL